jgi:hypothetical protein
MLSKTFKIKIIVGILLASFIYIGSFFTILGIQKEVKSGEHIGGYVSVYNIQPNNPDWSLRNIENFQTSQIINTVIALVYIILNIFLLKTSSRKLKYILLVFEIIVGLLFIITLIYHLDN